MVIRHVVGGANISVRSEPYIAASCHSSQSASSQLVFRKTHFSIILSSTSRSSKSFLPFRCADWHLVSISPIFHACYMCIQSLIALTILSVGYVLWRSCHLMCIMGDKNDRGETPFASLVPRLTLVLRRKKKLPTFTKLGTFCTHIFEIIVATFFS
jgi:hypothetical protein